MHEIIGLLFSIGVSFVLLMIGLVFGGAAERRHFRELQHREETMQHVLTTQVRVFLVPNPEGKTPRLVMAETVIASDYLKSFLGGLRKIFGGNIKSFETLLERGRREVTVKLKEQASELGYNAICNVRLTAANVGGVGGGAVAMAAVQGWATAYDATNNAAQPIATDGI
ncbi:MAG: heavy metal-binding domain-containing protein [Planctomycetota bacterium]